MTEAPPPGWAVIIPVKPTSVGKSRLDLPAVDRVRLARAIALDTIAAAAACGSVAQVYVVTDDGALLALAFDIPGLRFVPEDDGDALGLGVQVGDGDGLGLLGLGVPGWVVVGAGLDGWVVVGAGLDVCVVVGAGLDGWVVVWAGLDVCVVVGDGGEVVCTAGGSPSVAAGSVGVARGGSERGVPFGAGEPSIGAPPA